MAIRRIEAGLHPKTGAKLSAPSASRPHRRGDSHAGPTDAGRPASCVQEGRDDNRAPSPAASCPVEGPSSSRLSLGPGAEGARGEGARVATLDEVQRRSQ
eukprot:331398-Pyramimonas_sp.AAC.1